MTKEQKEDINVIRDTIEHLAFCTKLDYEEKQCLMESLIKVKQRLEKSSD